MASSASDATSKDRQVHVMDLDTGVTTALFDSYLRGVLHPHWYCQDTVLLNYTTENLHMLLKVRADGSGVSESLVTSLGVDIYHVEDPVTLFSPPDVGACGRSPDPAIVATVDQDTKESPSIPHVLSIVPGSTLDETFDLSLATGEPDEVNIEGDALRTFVGCHHPAWSPEGGQVMCTNLDDPEREERISIDGFHHNLEFRFTPTCSAGAITWGNAVRAFPPIDPTSLATAFTAFAGKYGFTDDDKGKIGFVYKYGEFCGSEDLFVVTLFVQDESAGVDVDGKQMLLILASRVLLYDAIVKRWWDLTSLAEGVDGADPGTYHGVYQTCGPVQREQGFLLTHYDVETWPPLEGA